MDTLSDILEEVITELDKYDEKRELVITQTRELNRLSGRGIAQLVMGKSVDHYYKKASDIYYKLEIMVTEIADLYSWKSATSGVEEFAEFAILYSILKKAEVPKPEHISVPSWIWLSALGDVTGELRRVILNLLLKDNIIDAKKFLSIMQEIFTEINGLSYSKSVIPNFRKKVDVARMTIERTEGDVLNYIVSRGSN